MRRLAALIGGVKNRRAVAQLCLLGVVTMGGMFDASPLAHAQFLEVPPVVRFAGVLVSVTDESKQESRALFVQIDRTELILLVSQAETLTGSYRGAPVLQRLFPRQVRIIGEDALLQRLLQPGILKKPLTVEGRLYFSSRQLLLSDVQVQEGQPPQAPQPQPSQQPRREKPAGIL